MDNRNCLIARLIVLISGSLLAIATAGLFVLGVITVQPALFIGTAVLGAVIMLAVYLAVIEVRPYDSVRRCVTCLGLLTFVAALALALLAVIALGIGFVPVVDVIGVLFVFGLALALWIAVIGLLQFMRCIATRCG